MHDCEEKHLVSAVDQWNFSTMKSCAGAKRVSETSGNVPKLSANSTNKIPFTGDAGLHFGEGEYFSS